MKNVPQYIQLTTVAAFTATELIPACCQIRMGVVVERDSGSAYCEDDLSLASALNFLSQYSEITALQWDILVLLSMGVPYTSGGLEGHIVLLFFFQAQTSQQHFHQRMINYVLHILVILLTEGNLAQEPHYL